MAVRTASRAVATVLAGGLTAAAVAGCYVDVGGLSQRTSSYRVPGGVQTLVVNAQVGSVHVTGGRAGPVSVTEHISYRHTAPASAHRTAAGTLTLDSNCPALETCSVGYDITVPAATTVQVTDNVGVIQLSSLSGPVTAHTNAGNIDLDGVSGTIAISDHAGSILGRDVSSGHALLRTSAGGIDVTFSAAPALISATATVGSVTLRVPGAVPYAVNAVASVGSATVSVTRSPASPHVIAASTRTGSIVIEPAS